jgi:hypothetical protein
MATITIDPVSGDDIISSFAEGDALVYTGTEQGLDGAILTFIYQIDYGSNRQVWQGAQMTIAADGKWSAATGGGGYTTLSDDGVYTFTARAIDNSSSASRHLIQADHRHTPFESVGLAFDGETQQLANFPSYLQIFQYVTAEQAGVDILQRDNIITTSQATKLGDFFSREVQVLGSQALSNDLLSGKQIDKLEHLQANTANYVRHTAALAALQPDHAGWTMPVLHSS